MTGRPTLAVIHARRGAAGLEAPNHQSGVQLEVALPRPAARETKESDGGDGFHAYFFFFMASLKEVNEHHESFG